MDTGELFSLLKDRRTVRLYQKKQIPRALVEKIIDAGRWASSLHGFQPWKFFVVRKEETIKAIAGDAFNRSKKLYAGYNFILRSTGETIANAPTVIVIYDKGLIQKKMNKMGGTYRKCAKISEVQAISGAIQNMILMAHALGVVSCWLVFPIFCEKAVNKLLGFDGQMIAMLTLGYPAEAGVRSARKPIDETVGYVE
ncbi:MAG: nitroreductase family protein [Candidatus Omnitrophota bacterium]